MSDILYPILFRYDDMTVPSGDDFPKTWPFKHLGGSVYETQESIHPEARFHWLIDAEAKLRPLRLISKHREWARPLSFLWRFVRERYELQPGRAITVGTLRELLKGTRLDEEKSLTPALTAFLRPYEDAAPFTPAMMQDFMNEGPDEE